LLSGRFDLAEPGMFESILLVLTL